MVNILKNRLHPMKERHETYSKQVEEALAASENEKKCILNAISDLDEWAHRYKITRMPMGLIELARLSFGPVIIPFHTPCFECYFKRRKSNDIPTDVNIRFGYEEIQQPSLSNHEFLLLFGLLLTRIQLGIGVFVQNQSAVISSFNRFGLDLVEDEVIFTPRCKRCSSHQFPSVEPYTPMPKRLK